MNAESGSRILGARPVRLALVAALFAAAVLLALMLRASGPTEAQAAPGDDTDVALTKSDSPDPVAEGGTLTYTIQVTNNGPNVADNVVVTDDLPKDLTFVSASAGCDNQGGKVTCSLGDLAVDATETVTITATVKNNAGNQVSNTASVTSDFIGTGNDTQANNNSDTEATKVNQGGAGGPSCRNRPAEIVGTGGNDVLIGTPGNDVIVAFAGDDVVRSGDGKDIVCANRGADLVNVGPRGDFAKGGGGPDLMKGRGGGDELRGNRGRDRLRGNRGPDLLAGGRGFDSCRGGAGADTVRSCP